MSYWTHVRGTITVTAPGRTQAEKRYILETVINHLPRVTGSEVDMYVHIVQRAGHNISCSHDEFGVMYTYYNKDKWAMEMQDEYILVLDGDLRDRMYKDTFKELNKFINRLAKRLEIEDMLVQLVGEDGPSYIFTNHKAYGDMSESPSWVDDSKGEPAWWEYMMWSEGAVSCLPIELEYKYYDVEETDREVKRRQEFNRPHDF